MEKLQNTIRLHFAEWLLQEKKVELHTCTKSIVNVPKGKNEKEFLAKLFAKRKK